MVPSFAAEPTSKPFLLHLPGIGGHMLIDDRVTSGMLSGGINADVEIYDWTGGQPGLVALASYDRNQIEAQKIADRLTIVYRADPNRRIILTSHSGGGGLAIWALEKLPEDVHIQTLLMLAPALSPEYDLSKALHHVAGNVYAFTSTLDWVVGSGTKMMGTIDRVNIESGGNIGFKMPAGADAVQYRKLIQCPYDATWTRLGNAGDHIGTMGLLFARTMLAPLLLTGELPKLPSITTRPATRAAG